MRLKLGTLYLLGRRLPEAREQALAVLAREPASLDALLLLAGTATAPGRRRRRPASAGRRAGRAPGQRPAPRRPGAAPPAEARPAGGGAAAPGRRDEGAEVDRGSHGAGRARAPEAGCRDGRAGVPRRRRGRAAGVGRAAQAGRLLPPRPAPGGGPPDPDGIHGEGAKLPAGVAPPRRARGRRGAACRRRAHRGGPPQEEPAGPGRPPPARPRAPGQARDHPGGPGVPAGAPARAPPRPRPLPARHGAPPGRQRRPGQDRAEGGDHGRSELRRGDAAPRPAEPPVRRTRCRHRGAGEAARPGAPCGRGTGPVGQRVPRQARRGEGDGGIPEGGRDRARRPAWPVLRGRRAPRPGEARGGAEGARGGARADSRVRGAAGPARAARARGEEARRGARPRQAPGRAGARLGAAAARPRTGPREPARAGSRRGGVRAGDRAPAGVRPAVHRPGPSLRLHRPLRPGPRQARPGPPAQSEEPRGAHAGRRDPRAEGRPGAGAGGARRVRSR